MHSLSGANILVSSEDGFKVALHEPVAKRLTNLFDCIHNVEDIRDPFGNIVIILAGVNCAELKAFSELLYAGQTWIEPPGIVDFDNIKHLLAESINFTYTVSKSKPSLSTNVVSDSSRAEREVHDSSLSEEGDLTRSGH